MVRRDLNAGGPGKPREIAALDTDAKLVRLWLHGRPATTRRAYERDAFAFLAHAGKPIEQVVLADLQSWLDGMTGQPASKRRRISAVKSLLSMGVELGWLRFDVGKALRIPRSKDQLAERILPEEDVLRMIQGEPDTRRRLFVRLLYLTGLRISEACELTWRDMTRRQQGGIANVFGKGGKTRSVPIGASLWKELMALRGDRGLASPVIPGHNGDRLDLKAADRIVKRAARRAGLPTNVSCHFLRHAHASHALDNGSPVHEVQATLGHSSLATTSRYVHTRPDKGSGSFLKG